ncbi:Flp family type IVb pilin [Kluyvera sichuanensis]|uniref:Flp family type IVb pilin n=1 Tax=Kluyvera sichuanensis TaxID=2725494 RepID=UPI0039F6682C
MNDLMIKTYLLSNAGLKKMRDFCKDQNGVTAVEYAIVLAGVAAVVAVVFGSGGQVQTMISGLFTKAAATVSANIK